MDDPELQAIRQRRMAELQAQQSQQSAQQQKMKSEMEERRSMILLSILTSEARERLARIQLVKPEKARKVEDMIINLAQARQLGGRVDENTLISLLNQLSKEQKETKIVYQRKKWDDEDY